MSETLGGIGSVATSAVPVLEKMNSTSGRLATARLDLRAACAVDCSSEVDGMRSAGMARLLLVELRHELLAQQGEHEHGRREDAGTPRR